MFLPVFEFKKGKCWNGRLIFYAPLGAGNSKLLEPLILLDYETAK